MNKKLFLTSMFALGFVGPAMAVPAKVFDTFPSGGVMEKDSQYTNAANVSNMLNVDGSAGNDTIYAVAQYISSLYNIPAGSYLPKGAETMTTGCVDGYYCPGATGVSYSSTTAQGLEPCPSGYNHSDTGARGASQCYKDCTLMENAESVTGKDYSGSVDTCEPSACVAGWHLTPRENGVVYGSQILSDVGSTSGVNSAYVTGGAELVQCTDTDAGCSGSYTASDYDLNLMSDQYKWAVKYGNGYVVKGSATVGSDNTCSCRMNGYRYTGNQYVMVSPLVSTGEKVSGANSDEDCARLCSAYMRESAHHDFRSSLLGATVPELRTCEANVIKVKWYNTTLADVQANAAGTITYGGNINTPKDFDATKTPKGKVFQGWRFSKTAPTDQTLANPD